jgi:chemotaxis protein CheZ
MKKAELQKLSEKVENAEKVMGALEKGELSTELAVEKVLKFMGEFHSLAHSVGSKGLAQLGRKIEKFASVPSPGAEQLTTLSYALGVLRKGMEDASAEGLRAAMIECLEVLGVEPLEMSVPFQAESGKGKSDREQAWSLQKAEVEKPRKTPTEAPVDAGSHRPASPVSQAAPAPVKPKPATPPAPPAAPEAPDSQMEQVPRRLGSKMVASPGPDENTARIELPTESLEKVEYLLSPFDAESPLTQQLSADDDRLQDILKEVKTFMASFVEGDLDEAQTALEAIANLQGDTGLFNEIGTMARNLHSSLKGLAHTLDPGLKELVEDKLPDSENRLEHILELTESAANTTMDHVETIRKRMEADQERLMQLEQHFARLKPMGDSAYHRMSENSRLVGELKASFDQTEQDLAMILTSQGYQDLTGQIITKIVNSQKELEGKLVNLVSYFGGKVRRDPAKKKDELYGPAHGKSDGAMHSQDQVDALLAEFGF